MAYLRPSYSLYTAYERPIDSPYTAYIWPTYVNHSRNFVDTITGAHTNTIEGCRFRVKKHLQRGVGWLRSDPDALALNLAEFT